VLGLGEWGQVQALLSSLFHLPFATAPWAVTAGEKSEPPARSARNSVGSNHELKSQAAAAKSEDFLTGMRIVGVWCDYIRNVGKLMHQHRDQPVVPRAESIVEVVREMVLFSAQVRASESALAFDLGSVQMQCDIRNAASKVDELVAELSVILMRYCFIDVGSIVQAPARSASFSNSSHMASATGSADSLQVSAGPLFPSVVPALRALLTSWSDSQHTEAMCRFLGAQLVNILNTTVTTWQHLRSSNTEKVHNRHLASVVGSLLRKMKLQLIRMAPVAAKNDIETRKCTAFTSASTSSSSSASLPHTISTQPTEVNALIAQVDAMLAELPPEKSEVDRLLRISDIDINA